MDFATNFVLAENATEKMKAFLNKTYPNAWRNLQLEHVDASGYWYSFELANDNRRQTWCIRHNEIIGGKNND